MPPWRQTSRIGDLWHDSTPWIGNDAERILNNLQQIQASLPIKMGGLGLRGGVLACTSTLSGFSCEHSSPPDPHSNLSLSDTKHARSSHDLRVGFQWRRWSPTLRHALWDRPLLQQTIKTQFQDTVDQYNTTRLKSVSSPHGSDWLYMPYR